MVPNITLISKPVVDFAALLSICHQALGYNPSAVVDASVLERSDCERFLSILAALRDQHAPAGLTANLLYHASVSVLMVADERDTLDIRNYCPGMSGLSVDTVVRNIALTVLTGTLAQWRDACRSGSTPAAEHNVRVCFNKLATMFQAAGLDLWKDCAFRPQSDTTFLIEDKRRS